MSEFETVIHFAETARINDGTDNIMTVEVIGDQVWVTFSLQQPPAYDDEETTFMIPKMQWIALRKMVDRLLNNENPD